MTAYRIVLLSASLLSVFSLSACEREAPQVPAAPAAPAAPDATPEVPEAPAAQADEVKAEAPEPEPPRTYGRGGGGPHSGERGGAKHPEGLNVIQLARVDRVKKSDKPNRKPIHGIMEGSGVDSKLSRSKPDVAVLSDERAPRRVDKIDDGLMAFNPSSRRSPPPKQARRPPPKPPRPAAPPKLQIEPPAPPKERTTPVRAPHVFEASEEVVAGDEFKDHGVNPMTLTSTDALSTFSVDVDTGAYALARRQISAGYRPAPASVRVEEYVNYFAYNYPAPKDGPFSVSMEVAPSPFEAAPGRYLMRVGLQGKHVDQRDRKPVHLTFLVDVSGSMDSLDKLPLAKQSLKILTNNLREGDSVALVTYAAGTRVVLPATDASYKGKILAAIDMLYADGATAMGSGIALAYQQADAMHKKGDVSRVIIMSDGDANVGDKRTMFSQVTERAQRGITLSTIGFGAGNYKDNLMEQLANTGDGNYYYIDSPREAVKVFGEQMSGTLEVIAKDVKIQVEFDPVKVESYRLIGYENRDIADKDFRNDKVDAGEIGAGHSVTAFYELVLKGAPDAGLATVRVRHKPPEGDIASEQVFAVGLTDLRAKLSYASLDFQFGAAVVAFAELLRASPYASKLSFALVEELATAASSPNQTERQEFITMVQKVRERVGE